MFYLLFLLHYILYIIFSVSCILFKYFFCDKYKNKKFICLIYSDFIRQLLYYIFIIFLIILFYRQYILLQTVIAHLNNMIYKSHLFFHQYNLLLNLIAH
jgi:hypothetical protein